MTPVGVINDDDHYIGVVQQSAANVKEDGRSLNE